MNSVISEMAKARRATNRVIYHYVYRDPTNCFPGIFLVRDLKEGNEMLYGLIKVVRN